MATTNPPPDSDSAHGSLGADITELVLTPLNRAKAFYARQVQSNLNQRPPELQLDAFGKRYFEGQPVPLKRLFATPLALSGKNMDQGVRHVSSGWGDARAKGFDEQAKYGTRGHQGLDFRAPKDETIFASADGRVEFVGFAKRPAGRTSASHPHVNDKNEVLDAGNNVVATPATLGHGGIYINIAHDGDFAGYHTVYMHCSDVLVHEGQRVLQGDPIGKVGRTGGDTGVTVYHLHWQVLYRKFTVNPSFLVPHYWPKHELVHLDGKIDQSTSSGIASINATKPMPAGLATMLNNTANQLQCLERQVKLQNLSSAEMKAMQATHALLVAKNLNAHGSAMYAAIAKFQQTLPRIENGVYFNFETGLWSDQTAAPAAGEGL